MADYVSIDEFNQGWTFFTKKIDVFSEKKYGEFPCSKFSCSGCHDWLHVDYQNRNVQESQSQFFEVSLLTIKRFFKPRLISELGKGGQAKVFKARFHGKDVAMKYIPLDKVKHGYSYNWRSYGCNEFHWQEKFLELKCS